MKGICHLSLRLRFGLIDSLLLCFVTAFFSNGAHAEACVGYGVSKFAVARVDEIYPIIFTENEKTASGRLAQKGPLFFANPISQVFLSLKAIDSGKPGIALAHLDLASFLNWENNLCAKRSLEYFILVTRKFILEEHILSGSDRQLYMNMTTGLVNRDHEIVSQEYSKVRGCLDSLSLDQNSNTLVFSNC